MTRIEKRRVQRIDLEAPVTGHFGSQPVVLTDVSLLGARIEVERSIAPGKRARLSFESDGSPIDLECAVVHCQYQPSRLDPARVAHVAGVRFSEQQASAVRTLRKLILELVTASLGKQKYTNHAAQLAAGI